jgi:tetratricopeptide (TPR) repeat protein
MRLSVLLLPALCLALLAAPRGARAQAGGRDPDELFAKAVALHETGDILGAIQYYEAVLEKQPDRAEARSNLGAALMKIGRFEEAITQYRKALETRPEMTNVRFNLALAYYKADRLAEAAPEFAKVLEQSPKHPAATLLLADCRLRMGESAKVVELLSPLESEMGNDRLFSYLLGTALLDTDQLERGQAVIDRLFRSGESAEAHVLLGAQYLRQGQAIKAVPEIAKAVEMNPALPGVHALYGRALRQNHDNPGAMVQYRAELDRNPNDFESNLWLGLLQTESNQLDEALEHLKRAGRMRPGEPAVAYGLGRVHLAAERLDEAREQLEQLVKLAPSYRQGHVLLATVYYRLQLREKGDEQRAIVEKLRAEEKNAQTDEETAPPGQ